MSKRKDVFNSPEYRHIEEHLDEILNELEGDEETRNMTMPEAWDQDFREVLERVKKEKKQRHRSRFCRTLAAAAAAVIVLVPVIGFVGPETVEGDGILELFEKNIFMNDRRYGMAGTDENGLAIDPQNSNEIIFCASDIKELYEKLDQEIAHPFYKLTWIPEGFSIHEAIYNKEYDALNIELYNDTKYIYLSQKVIVGLGGGNNVTEDEIVGTVQDNNIGMSVDIYQSLSESGLSFSIIDNNIKFDCYAETTLEDCVKIAESIVYN